MKTIRFIIILLLFGASSLAGRSSNPPNDCVADFDYTYVPTTPIYIQFTDINDGRLIIEELFDSLIVA